MSKKINKIKRKRKPGFKKRWRGNKGRRRGVKKESRRNVRGRFKRRRKS